MTGTYMPTLCHCGKPATMFTNVGIGSPVPYCAEHGPDWFGASKAELNQVRAERDKLQAFKDWVHKYLDDHGVPHHPPGTHGADGCRIGDRMDWLMAREAELRAGLADAKALISGVVLNLIMGNKPTREAEAEVNRVVDRLAKLLAASAPGGEGE